ncbi:phosphatidylinositol-3,4,5-trisphosphate 3-phosphatase [Aureococcus anophagefferens]|uniref:Phosphatidylinositol-3,4,5-trisphosphate 3-phosphatase n=1 Tax=Aureococcus anophagefferens TaxID=44056 RepID=A0ABR1FVP8_AURAN
MNFKEMRARMAEAATKAKAEAMKQAAKVETRLKDTERNRAMVASFVEKVGATLEELVDEGAPREERKIIDLTYVTDRFIAMGFPWDGRSSAGSAAARQTANPIKAVAAHLRSYHEGHYMVLNVSEEQYDYGTFDMNVLEFEFPGHPAPPLGMLFKICASLESWIAADAANVAAVHCLTGRGRTSVVLACVLAWLGEFETPLAALRHVADARKDDVERLTIPSQRRYVQYFSNVLDGVAPRSEPLLLRRAIMHGIPNFAGDARRAGCCPYLQFFKGGRLAYTTTWAGAKDDLAADGVGVGETKGGEEQRKPARPWAGPAEGSLVFHVDCVVHGDLLVRCRHLDEHGGRTSMFRAALHALDGACGDDRFDDDFFVDLIFAPLERENDEDGGNDAPGGSAAARARRRAAGEARARRPARRLLPAYDALLHKDSLFWRDIEDRKTRARGGARPRRRPTRPSAAGRVRRLACADDVLWIKDAKSDKEDIKTCETLAEIRAEGKKFRKGKRKGKKHNKKWKHFCKKWKGSVGGEVMSSMKAKDACAATCGTCDPMADALVTDPFDPKGFMEQDASNQETPW